MKATLLNVNPSLTTFQYPFHHLNTPTIAITAAESNSQLHKDSIQVNLKAASRRRYSTMYLAPPMRRCKSAMASNDSLESRMSDNVPIVVHSADGLVKVPFLMPKKRKRKVRTIPFRSIKAGEMCHQRFRTAKVLFVSGINRPEKWVDVEQVRVTRRCCSSLSDWV